MSGRICAVIPAYDNPRTLPRVVETLSLCLEAVIVVDDGSAEEGRAVAQDLESRGLAVVRRHERNRGKGAAVKTGLAAAWELGFTHALQVDADGQHDLADVPRFLAASRESPDALILGCPVFDSSAPSVRRRGRKISIFWTTLENGARVIEDPLCGFRVYPVEDALRARAKGERMEFDPEVAVRMVWNGSRVVNLPTQVRYLSPEDGGVSHFRMVRDNIRMIWAHTRLVTLALLRVVTLRRLRPT